MKSKSQWSQVSNEEKNEQNQPSKKPFSTFSRLSQYFPYIFKNSNEKINTKKTKSMEMAFRKLIYNIIKTSNKKI